MATIQWTDNGSNQWVDRDCQWIPLDRAIAVARQAVFLSAPYATASASTNILTRIQSLSPAFPHASATASCAISNCLHALALASPAGGVTVSVSASITVDGQALLLGDFPSTISFDAAIHAPPRAMSLVPAEVSVSVSSEVRVAPCQALWIEHPPLCRAGFEMLRELLEISSFIIRELAVASRIVQAVSTCSGTAREVSAASPITTKLDLVSAPGMEIATRSIVHPVAHE